MPAHLKRLLIIGGLVLLPLTASPALAQQDEQGPGTQDERGPGASVIDGLNEAAGEAGYSENVPVANIVAGVINAVIGMSGLVLVVLLIYGGVLYMTAGGDTDKVQKAKSTMVNAVIGLVIVIAAFAIANFVLARISDSLF